MRRTPLHRYMPIKRGTKQLKRTRMGFSAKQFADPKGCKGIRLARMEYRALWTPCPWTGRSHRMTIHEIVGGRFRQRTVVDPRFWLPCDWDYHQRILQNEPRPRQWARKIWLDDGHFDLAALTELPGFYSDWELVKEQFEILCQELGRRSFHG